MRSILAATLFLLAGSVSAQDDLSTIAVPIRTSLGPLLPLIEAKVPNRYKDSRRELGSSVTFEVTRDPIRLEMIGERLHATTTAHYSIEGCAFRRCLSCGVDEPKRDAVIKLQSQFVWDKSWRLRSTTEAQPADFPNRCRIILGADVTEHFIAPIVDDQLREVAWTIDQNTPGLTDMQPTASDIWRSLQEPAEIGPRTFLIFEPLTAALGPISGSGLHVTSTLTLRARTRVVVGEKPQSTAIPLPQLDFGESTGGLRVPLDIELPYADASQLATQEFGHRTYKLEDGNLTIGEIRIGPGSAGRISLSADIEYPRYTGPVVLEGTPRFDPSTKTVIVTDLDYSVETKERGLFFKIGERLAHESVRAKLRESARWPLKDQLALAADEINKAMNRQVSPGVVLRGQVAAVEPQRVTPAPHSLIVRVVVTGSAEVVVPGRSL